MRDAAKACGDLNPSQIMLDPCANAVGQHRYQQHPRRSQYTSLQHGYQQLLNSAAKKLRTCAGRRLGAQPYTVPTWKLNRLAAAVGSRCCGATNITAASDDDGAVYLETGQYPESLRLWEDTLEHSTSRLKVPYDMQD